MECSQTLDLSFLLCIKKNTAQTVPYLEITYSFLHADVHIFLW